MSENRCVCCGAIIPEGRQVCPACEAGTGRDVGTIADERILACAQLVKEHREREGKK